MSRILSGQSSGSTPLTGVASPSLVLTTATTLLGGGLALVPWGEGHATGLAVGGLLLAYLAASTGKRAEGPARQGWIACRHVIVAAFATRALVGLFQEVYRFLPTLYVLDAGGYHEIGSRIADAWVTGDGDGVRILSRAVAGDATALQGSLTAVVYTLVGRSVLTMHMVSGFVAALSLYYLFLIGEQILGRRRAWLVVALMAFWPSHVLWTSQNLRDPWIYYFLARALHAGTLWLTYERRGDWAKAALFVVLVGVFRRATGTVLALAFLVMSVVALARRRTWALRVPALGLGLLGVTALALVLSVSNFLQQVLAESPTELSALRRGFATGGSAYYPELVYRQWTDVLAFLPVGVLYLLLAPFPWQLRNPAQLASALENVPFTVVLAAACIRVSYRRDLHRAAVALIGLFLLFAVVAFAVVEGNIGTAYRHKMQFVPYLLLLAMPGHPGIQPARATAGAATPARAPAAG